jgi:hypothetical protein
MVETSGVSRRVRDTLIRSTRKRGLACLRCHTLTPVPHIPEIPFWNKTGTDLQNLRLRAGSEWIVDFPDNLSSTFHSQHSDVVQPPVTGLQFPF